MEWKKSNRLYKRACELIPGGVNSPVRAFRAVGGNPIFIDRGKGSKIYDVDGNAYIDYVLSWGPLILGHSHPKVVNALKKAAEKGTSYGAPTPLEIELAELVLKVYPSMDKVRMVNSGTEATMSAIRVARGFTGRDKIIKFEGCYHGHADGLLVKAGSGATTFGVPDSPGVPVVGNIGCVLPKPGFLESLRKLTKKFGIVLIFDEVMTGFRVAFGGAQAYYGIRPDMTCLGKVIGGGLPVGAYGGKKEIMSMVSPEGPVYQAGTLSGNPLAMTGGIETLRILSKENTYNKLETTGALLEEGLADAARKAGVKTRFYRAGTMFCTYFTNTDVIDYKTAKTSDTARFSRFFSAIIKKGVYIAPSQFEAGFISLAHTEKDIEKTVKAAYESLVEIK